MSKKNTAGRAVRYLRDFISSHAGSSQTPIPGVRAMAQRAGVSHVTMARAFKTLSAEGLLDSFPGRGTYSRDHDDAQVRSDNRALSVGRIPLRWQQLELQLRKELAAGAYRGGMPLPSTKELCARYHVSYPTLRKALFSLRHAGDIDTRNGRHVVTDTSSQSSHAYICVIVRAATPRQFEFFPHQARSLLRAFESVCRDRGITLLFNFVEYNSFQTIVPSIPIVECPRRMTHRAFFGFMFLALAIDDSNSQQILTQCSLLNYPCVVLGIISPGLNNFINSLSSVFCVPFERGYDAGQVVGRYLIRNGHRGIAGVHTSPISTWAQDRFAGIRQAFHEAGIPASFSHRAIHRRLSEDIDIRVRLKEFIQMQRRPLEREAVSRTVSRLQYPATAMWWDELFRRRLRSNIASLLTNETITAWVAENDELAILVMEELREMGVSIPGRISLVGFDDIDATLFEGLCSYNFNYREMSQLAVELLSSGKHRHSHQQGKQHYRIEGYIQERESVRTIIPEKR